MLAGCIVLLPAASIAQKKAAPSVKKIPMKAEHWTVHSGKASFEKYKDVDAIRLEAGGLAILKEHFPDGTVHPVRLFLAAFPPTLVAALAYWAL